MVDMRQSTRFAVLAAMLAAACGCSRDEGVAAPAEPSSPAAPESYMKDKAFRAKLDEQTAKRGDLAKARNAVVAKMTEMIEAKKRELKTDDEAKLKAELAKDPAWNELYKRCQDANAAIGENRRDTMAVVRERLTKPAAGSRQSNVKQGNLK